jgi:catechol 2,3-dioxygenase-like lactoylglutathione lyase family enzyme
MKTRLLLIGAALMLIAASSGVSLAQLPPPNDLGVRLGHIHVITKDMAAQKHFLSSIGGTIVNNGPLTMAQFPGVSITLEQGEPSGPPAGSVVNHWGFVVKDLAAARAAWKAASVRYDPGNSNPNQGYLYGPDDIRIEIFGDPSLPGPISMDHIHSYVPAAEIPAIQEWYRKVLGGMPGTRQRVAQPGITPCVYFHRFNVSFNPSDTKLAPTKGRSLDRLGFDVRNLDELVKKLEAQGIKLDEAPHVVPGTKIKVAILTDPWGTSIELVENLSPSAT